MRIATCNQSITNATLFRTGVDWMRLVLVLSGLLAIGPPAASAAEPVKETWQILDRQVDIHTGTVELGEQATLVVPDGMVFLGPQDAEFVNFVILGNQSERGSTLGMIVPQEMREVFTRANKPVAATEDTGADAAADMPEIRDWVFLLNWADGHVPVDEGLAADADRLLVQLQEADRRASSSPSPGNPRPRIITTHLDLLGWAEPPTYERKRNALIWPLLLNQSTGVRVGRDPRTARSLGGSTQEILNYQVRLLGARGYILMVAVCDSEALPQIAEATNDLIARFSWSSGEDYASYRQGADPHYPQGIVGMLAGVIEGDPVARGRRAWGKPNDIANAVIAIVVLLGVGSGVYWFLLRSDGRRQSPASRSDFAPNAAQDSTARRCPRCAQVLHHDAKRCPACGASTIAKS